MHTRPTQAAGAWDNDVQIYSSLVFLPATKSCPDSARELLHGAHGRAFLSAIGASGRRCVGVDGDDRLAGKVGDRNLCVVTRGDVTGEASVALGVGGQSDQVGLRVRSGGHDGWARPSRPCVVREQQKMWYYCERVGCMISLWLAGREKGETRCCCARTRRRGEAGGLLESRARYCKSALISAKRL